MTLIQATRYHDISIGHRVHGHESKCALIHGHNIRVHFTCVAPELDKVGRVMDFSVINNLLCQWLETNWDHRFLAWKDDPIIKAWDTAAMRIADDLDHAYETWQRSIVYVPVNPTAENLADYLLNVVAPYQLMGTTVDCVQVRIDETRKCSAIATRKDDDDARG